MLVRPLLFLSLFITNVIALECRFGMSMHFAHSKKVTLEEKKLVCSSDEAMCGRVTVKATVDDKNVTLHTASCINEEDCTNDETKCSILNLHNINNTMVEYQQLHSCRTKCCRHNNCNVHKTQPQSEGRKRTHIHQSPVKPLKCFSGIKEHDHMGRLLQHELTEKTCLYSSYGGRKMSQSRCLSAEVVTRKINGVSITTTVSHCVHLSMCTSLTCNDMQAMLIKDEDEVFLGCNITCCSDNLCNEGTSTTPMFLCNFIFISLLTLFYLS